MNDDLYDEAARVGVRLDRKSHWPVAWHRFVMAVLREGVRLGVETVGFKIEQGRLSVHGGDEKLGDAVALAQRLTDRTCVVCAAGFARRTANDFPFCARCGAEPRAWGYEIEWVEY